jgi:photosystem II stability/assembly factor-like uncharacterized protein
VGVVVFFVWLLAAAIYASAASDEAFVEEVAITSGFSGVADDYLRVNAKLGGSFYMAASIYYAMLPNYGFAGFVLGFEVTVEEETSGGWLGPSYKTLKTVTFEHEYDDSRHCVYIDEECGYGPFWSEGVDEEGSCEYCGEESLPSNWPRMFELRNVRVLKVTQDYQGKRLRVSVRARVAPISDLGGLPPGIGFAGFGWLFTKEWTDARTSDWVTITLEPAPRPEATAFSAAPAVTGQLSLRKGDSLDVFASISNLGGYSWKTWLAISLSPGLEYVSDSFYAGGWAAPSTDTKLMQYPVGSTIQDRRGQQILAQYDLLDIEMLDFPAQRERSVHLTLRATEAGSQWIKYRLTSRAGLPDERLWSFEDERINDVDQQGWPAVKVEINVAGETESGGERAQPPIGTSVDGAVLTLAPIVSWDKLVGADVGDFDTVTMIAAADGGYILVGQCDRSRSEGGMDVCLIKVDGNGDTVWKTVLGESEHEYNYVHSAAATADGGCVIVGQTGCDAWLVKVDARGAQEWAQTFGEDQMDIETCVEADSISVIPDGGYVLLGRSVPNTRGNYEDRLASANRWLLRTDARGNLNWRVSLDVCCPLLHSVVRSADGGMAIIGTASWSVGEAYLVKTSPDGRVRWSRLYEEEAPCGTASSLLQSADGGYVFVQTRDSNSEAEADSDIWLVKTSSEGNKEWEQSYTSSKYDEVAQVVLTVDGGYILVGATTLPGEGSLGIWVIKTDVNGEKEWETTLGDVGTGEGVAIAPTPDGGYLVLGRTYVNHRAYASLVKLVPPIQLQRPRMGGA